MSANLNGQCDLNTLTPFRNGIMYLRVGIVTECTSDHNDTNKSNHSGNG